MDKIKNDSPIRAVILTGASDRAFSASGDIHRFTKSIKQSIDIAVKEFVHRGQAMTSRVESFPKLIIVAVNGVAFGGG